MKREESALQLGSQSINSDASLRVPNLRILRCNLKWDTKSNIDYRYDILGEGGYLVEIENVALIRAIAPQLRQQIDVKNPTNRPCIPSNPKPISML